MLDSFLSWYWRSKFEGEKRDEFYVSLALQLQSGVQILPSCDTLYEIHSDEGRKPNAILAIVSQECAAGIANGVPIHETLGRWVPYDEQSSIQSGATIGASERSDSLAEGLERARKIIVQKKLMRMALIKAMASPLFTLAATFAAFYFVCVSILPQFAAQSHRQGHAYTPTFAESFGMGFAHYGPEIAFGIVVLVFAVIMSFGRLTGRARLYLDKIPPWNIYRMVEGAKLIYNIGILLKGGMQKVEMLEMLAQNAPPYLRERIEGALLGVRNGKTLGDALYESGYDFPSREAVAYVRVIGGLKGGDEQLMVLGEKWMERTIEQLDASAVFFKNLAIILGGILATLLATVINDMWNGLLVPFGAM